MQQQKQQQVSNNHRHNYDYEWMKAYIYMILLAIQFGIQPILTRTYTPSGIIRSTVILIQEVFKLIIAFTMLQLSEGKNSKNIIKDWNIIIWISVAFIPAGLYSIQNLAALTAYQHLDAMTYNVLNQTKTLSAALCCYIIMNKKQSIIQIISLLLLLLSALTIEGILKFDTIIEYISSILFMNNNSIAMQHQEERRLQQLQQSEQDEQNFDPKHYTHGVLPILLASFISGLAGALSQNNLQGTGGRNIYLFSMELCAASILLLSLSLLFSEDGRLIYQYGYWYHWNISTFIPILSNSFGGILVGLVTKYAGSVQKGFALIFGIFLSGIIQAILQPNKNVTNEQWIGGLLAAISLYLHSSYPPKKTLSSSITSSSDINKIETKTVKKD